MGQRMSEDRLCWRLPWLTNEASFLERFRGKILLWCLLDVGGMWRYEGAMVRKRRIGKFGWFTDRNIFSICGNCGPTKFSGRGATKILAISSIGWMCRSICPRGKEEHSCNLRNDGHLFELYRGLSKSQDLKFRCLSYQQRPIPSVFGRENASSLKFRAHESREYTLHSMRRFRSICWHWGGDRTFPWSVPYWTLSLSQLNSNIGVGRDRSTLTSLWNMWGLAKYVFLLRRILGGKGITKKLSCKMKQI